MKMEEKKQLIVNIYEQALLSVFGASPRFLETCRGIIYKSVEEVFENETPKVVSLNGLYERMQQEEVPEQNCKEILVFLQSKTQNRGPIFSIPTFFENLPMSERRNILRKVSRKIDEVFPESTDKVNVSMDSQEVSQKKYLKKSSHVVSTSAKGKSSSALKIIFALVLISSISFYFLVLKGKSAENIVLSEESGALKCEVLKGSMPTAICIVNDAEVSKHKDNLQDKLSKTQSALQAKGYSDISILTSSGKFLLNP